MILKPFRLERVAKRLISEPTTSLNNIAIRESQYEGYFDTFEAALKYLKELNATGTEDTAVARVYSVPDGQRLYWAVFRGAQVRAAITLHQDDLEG